MSLTKINSISIKRIKPFIKGHLKHHYKILINQPNLLITLIVLMKINSNKKTHRYKDNFLLLKRKLDPHQKIVNTKENKVFGDCKTWL